MSENHNIIAVYKSRNNLLDILETRGYDVTSYKGFSISEIHTLVTQNLLDMVVTNSTTNKQVYIKYYNLEKTIRPSNVHELIESLFSVEEILKPNDELLIIVKDEPNETIQKLQRSVFEHDNIFVNIINIERLQFNILNHILVPNHRVLTEEESDDIKKEYNIKNDKDLPSVSRFDPVSQVLGIRPGELFEITRSSKTAINTKFYRICST